MYKLSKQGILRKNNSFQAVYRSGKSFANKSIVLYVLPNQGAKRKVGFAAGKRLGNAVIRNRVKRLLREAYRLNQHLLTPDVDLILVGRQAMVKSRYSAVAKAFLDLCGKARILSQVK